MTKTVVTLAVSTVYEQRGRSTVRVGSYGVPVPYDPIHQNSEPNHCIIPPHAVTVAVIVNYRLWSPKRVKSQMPATGR